MGRPARQILDRLGSAGLDRVLNDALDQNQLVDLANACGVKYPGMRAQSQTRERLLADIVLESAKNEVARKAIVRTLAKEMDTAARDWAKLAPEERARRLCDESFLLGEGNLGRMLYLVATHIDGTLIDGFGQQLAQQYLLRIASNGSGPAPTAMKAPREETRLKRSVSSLEKKARHLEGQLAKSRESQKTFKRDLIERKGELAESRMLVERLRLDLAGAQRAAPAAPHGRPEPDKSAAGLGRLVRNLAAQQQKLLERVEKQPAAVSSAPAHTEALSGVLASLAELQKKLAADRQEHRKEVAAHAKQIEELVAAVQTRRTADLSVTRRTRVKPQEQRVGVFIDVQNMHYAARQLKGKLDFNALMDAAVQDRRLIQAVAYVVETKEIDQSQFIAVLEQRGITVQRKPLRVRADGSMKGNWDMELALDILDAAPRLDVVVLVSGDGDFTSLVKRVRAMGPRVEVIAFPRTTAKSLLETADSFQPLDRKFMIYPKKTPRAKDSNGRDMGDEPTTAATAPGGPSRDRPKAPRPPAAEGGKEG